MCVIDALQHLFWPTSNALIPPKIRNRLNLSFLFSVYSNSNFLPFCNGIFQNIGLLTFVFIFYSGEFMYMAVLPPPLVDLFVCSEPSISLFMHITFLI